VTVTTAGATSNRALWPWDGVRHVRLFDACHRRAAEQQPQTSSSTMNAIGVAADARDVLKGVPKSVVAVMSVCIALSPLFFAA
jgi:hypothetical protein